MVFFGSKSIFRTSRISEDIRPHILPELDLRNIGFPKIFDTVRFICRISRISEDCLLWEYSIFPNYSDFRIGYRRCSLCRISRISKDCLLRQCSIFHICRIFEDILHMLWQCSICRISRISEDVQQCSIFPEVIKDYRRWCSSVYA